MRYKITGYACEEMRTAIHRALTETNTPMASITTKRLQWDALWLAVDHGYISYNRVYREGINDSHIDSALERIFEGG
jgi:hypothetical protein